MTVLFFTAPYCAPCAQIKDWVTTTTQSNKHTLEIIDVTTPTGKESAANMGVLVTPELVVIDAQGKKAAHLIGADKIKSELESALGIKNMQGWIMLGGGIALGGLALYMLSKRKRKGIGRIVSSNNRAGRTICRDRMRSTSKGAGSCSYHAGVSKETMQREYNFNRSLKKGNRLNGIKKRKSVTKKK